jgi:hypothetical protein
VRESLFVDDEHAHVGSAFQRFERLYRLPHPSEHGGFWYKHDLVGGAPISNPWIRLFALIEGFVGAFLVALFVFTLTRSIHR